MIFRNNISIATICPLTFVESLVKTSVYPERYLQRFGTSDVIHVQFMSDNDLADTFTMKAYHAIYDMLIGSVTFVKQTLSAGIYYWDAYYPCTTLLAEITALNLPYIDNNVYFQIETANIYNYSLPVKIESSVESVQLRYHNSFNTLETVFNVYSLDSSFILRVDGGFAPAYIDDDGEHDVFYNQKNEPSLSYSMPRNIFTLSVNGMSDEMWLKLRMILRCDTLLINNIQYMWNGQLEAVQDVYGLRGAKIQFIPKTNRMTQTIEGDVMLTTQDGTIITDELDNALTISPTLE